MAQSYATRWLLTRKMGNGAAARESMRQFSSWLGKREDDFAAQRLDDPFSDYWHIGNDAIGDTILAILRLKGPRAAIQEVLNWRSNEIALNVAIDLSFKLAASNESNLLAECAELSHLPKMWRFLLRIPLLLSGVDEKFLDCLEDLKELAHSNVLNIGGLDAHNEDRDMIRLCDIFLLACELSILKGAPPLEIAPLLQVFSSTHMRDLESLHGFQTSRVDFALRATALIELLEGRDLTFESFVFVREIQKDVAPKQRELIEKGERAAQ